MTPPSLLILEIGSDTIGCQFLNWQRRSFLPIFESAATQFLVADFWIDSNVVLLPISKLTAAQLLAADF